MGSGLAQAGVIANLITPFTLEGAIHWEWLRDEAGYLDRSPVDGICIGGVISDTAGMEPDQLYGICESVRAKTKKPVYATIFPDVETEAIEMARAVASAGARGVFIAQPHYLCQPDVEGLAEMFRAVRAAAGIPVLLANCISTSMLSLPDIQHLIFQDAVDGILQAVDIHLLVDLLRLHSSLPIFSGVEDLHYVGLLLGAAGIVSDLATAFPTEMADLYRAVREGRHESARSRHEMLARIWRVLDHPHEGRLRFRTLLAERDRRVGAPSSPYHLPELDLRKTVRAALRTEGLL